MHKISIYGKKIKNKINQLQFFLNIFINTQSLTNLFMRVGPKLLFKLIYQNVPK